MAEQSTYQLFVGVDVAAASFTAAWSDNPTSRRTPYTFAQTPAGYAAFQEQLLATKLAPSTILIVLEATGSYWVTLAFTLHQTGFVVSVVHPNHVHNYAKSLPQRAKTDSRDADLLAAFARERQPAPWTPPADVYHELRQRLVARDALLEMRKQARNHLHALAQWPVQIATAKVQLEAVVADLDQRIAALEREISTVLQESVWAESALLLQTIHSIGPLTTAWLLVLTLNFQQCPTAAAAVAYAGLAPLPHESGTSVRGRSRIGHGGNKRLRTTLYLATLNAARFNPVIREFYQRLRAAGKPAKVARCAAARKLLQIAWAVVTKRRAFDPQYHAEQEALPV
ncbi:MAG: IS110 family transposase [Chloroflexota bacterium]|nr:IS110 family transposase [Chloroflexota bacterium]